MKQIQNTFLRTSCLSQTKGKKFGLKRGVEVIRLLHKYGVLSSRTLRMMMNPMPERRQLAKTLRLLHTRGLIVRQAQHFHGSPSPYHFLSQSRRARLKLAKILNLELADLSQRRLRYSHMMHEDMLSELQFNIEKHFPGAITVRDWQIHRSKVPELVMPRTLSKEDFYPDLIVGIKGSVQAEGNSKKSSIRWIVIELERSRKRHARVHLKLRDYAERTGFDGLLYVVPESVLEKRYQYYFRDKGAAKALHLRGLTEGYFATTHLPDDGFEISEHRLQLGKWQTTILKWMNFLLHTTKHSRREILEECHKKETTPGGLL